MLERRQETKIVKEALTKAGYTDVRVKHGTGTAWGWLIAKVTTTKPEGCYCVTYPEEYNRVKICRLCSDVRQVAYSNTIEIILKITGRHGEYDGNTNVTIRLKE